MEQAPFYYNYSDVRGSHRFMGYQQPPRHAAYNRHRQSTINAYQNYNDFRNTQKDADNRSFAKEANACERSVSNLNRFLEHTTPKIDSLLHSKTHARGLSLKSCSSASLKHYFTLSDLWESFDEWSAYGAGVPIVFNGKDTVMQYYVPYLSAIQLYTSSRSVLFMKNRRLGDDSDGSEMDYRDSTSEISSDGETEKTCSEGSNFSCNHGPWNLVESGDASSTREGNETLLYEYFEATAPSLRVPLYDKVQELARQFPGLKSLCSDDLSCSSWLSVAWYPIYRIPTGPTLKDLAACFLTYHSLSTLSADGIEVTNNFSTPTSESKVSLHPFGLASYKFRGAVWISAGVADRQCATSLQRSSDEWLKRLGVQHPDFEYFMSHGVPARH